MALDNMERAALHDDLADRLGRTTAGRLMAALPDWSQLATKDYLDERFERIDERFERIDERFERIDERFEFVDHQLTDVHRQFTDVNRQFKQVTSRLDRLDARFENVDEIIEGKVDVKLLARVRSTFFAILGLTAAYAAMLAAIVGMALAAAD